MYSQQTQQSKPQLAPLQKKGIFGTFYSILTSPIQQYERDGLFSGKYNYVWRDSTQLNLQVLDVTPILKAIKEQYKSEEENKFGQPEQTNIDSFDFGMGYQEELSNNQLNFNAFSYNTSQGFPFGQTQQQQQQQQYQQSSSPFTFGTFGGGQVRSSLSPQPNNLSVPSPLNVNPLSALLSQPQPTISSPFGTFSNTPTSSVLNTTPFPQRPPPSSINSLPSAASASNTTSLLSCPPQINQATSLSGGLVNMQRSQNAQFGQTPQRRSFNTQPINNNLSGLISSNTSHPPGRAHPLSNPAYSYNNTVPSGGSAFGSSLTNNTGFPFNNVPLSAPQSTSINTGGFSFNSVPQSNNFNSGGFSFNNTPPSSLPLTNNSNVTSTLNNLSSIPFNLPSSPGSFQQNNSLNSGSLFGNPQTNLNNGGF